MAVETEPKRSDRSVVWLTVGAAVAVAAALVLSRRTGLWLDEAQSVAIARLPLSGLVDALRTDGSPPLFYVLLHGWIRLFGTGDVAVRSLSAVFAVATVPVAVAAAQRTLGRRAGLLAGAVVVSAPFFYRYATEARMYSLVVLLAALVWLAVDRARMRPSAANLLAVAGLTGALALTHYWALFAVIPAVAMLAWQRQWPIVAAMAGGALVFAPWLPTFAYQLAHTGAPWGPPASLDVYEMTVRGFAGGRGRLGALGFVYVALIVAALFGRPKGDDVRLDVRGSPLGMRLGLAVVLPLALGLAVSAATGSPFAGRYAAIVFLPFAMLVALGVALTRPVEHTRVVLAVLLVLGGAYSIDFVVARRTQAPAIAALLADVAAPNDLVVFCPDQLAPAVTRLSHGPAPTVAYPTGDSGRVVDWVDYRDRNRAADPVAFARQAAATAARGTVWLVQSPGYRTFGTQCGRLASELRRLRPGSERLIRLQRSSYEHASLWRFPANLRGASSS